MHVTVPSTFFAGAVVPLDPPLPPHAGNKAREFELLSSEPVAGTL
jgi:hypothetical protein